MITVSRAYRISRVLVTGVIRITFALAVATVLFLSRFPLIPSALVTFDAANFAFALQDFNPALHKPQPPGYPFYVGFTRLLHAFIGDLPTLFTIAGIAATLGAVLALARLSEEIAGWRAAVGSGVLLSLHPAVWTSGLLDPVRVFLSFASASIGLLAWRAWNPGSHRGWIIGAWAALGLFSGFRPTVVLLLAPLCLAACLRRRTSALDWAYCGLALSMTVAIWVGACAWAVGGVPAYMALLRDYSDQQFADTSLLFGAPVVPALKMAGRALIWSLAPAVCWVWLLFLAPASVLFVEIRRVGSFLLLWTIPALLFATLFHSAEPGHVLTIVTPVCLTGGLVLAAALGRFRGFRWTVTSIAAVATGSILLFFFPPTGVMRVVSVQAIWLQEQRVAPALALIDTFAKQEPVTLISSPSSTVPWRVLAYYYPNVPLIVLDGRSGVHKNAGYRVIRRGRLQSEGIERVSIACSGAHLWFLSADSGVTADGTGKFQRTGPALLTRANAGVPFRVSGVEFAPAPPCPPLLARD